ncbi:MAG: HAD family phosphatase [Spirochaetes bacterium]|nr:HAD family phosphatase [Spirochaetota bacterium]
MGKQITAVIFDLDATLLDTEPNWYLADKKMLQEYGIDFTMEMKRKYIGQSIKDMIDDLKKTYDISASYDELYEKKNGYYLEIAKNNTMMFPEMKNVFNRLLDENLTFALASGTAKKVIEALFEDMEIKKFFKVLVSSEEVNAGKPDPAVFLETASRINTAPENILVFEDSHHGVEAAIRAGMSVVAVPYLITRPLNAWFHKADLLFENGMTSLNWEDIEKRFFRQS